MKKLFRKIHLWISVPLGIIITLVCFSGAMLVFEEEIVRSMHRDIFYTQPAEGARPLPAEALTAAVARTLPEGTEVTGITLFADPARTWQVTLSQPRRAYVCVDPYTGEIKPRVERPAFFACMFRLHRWLLDSVKPGGGTSIGKLAVGIATLGFVIVLLTGVIIWWPRTRQALRNSLKIATRKGWRRFWFDLHVAGGMYALLFLLAMALTGLTWSFPWYRTGFYKAFGIETQQGGGHGPAPAQAAPSGKDQAPERSRQGHADGASERSRHRENDTAPLHWQQVCDRLMAANPGWSRIALTDGSASVTFAGRVPRSAADRYAFDSRSGAITSATLYRDAPGSTKMRGWIFGVHTGGWGGTLTRVLAFLAALIGATLPATGYYLWIRRLVHNRR